MTTRNSNQSEKRLRALSAVVSVAAVVWLTGCHSTGYKKSDAASWNSQAAAREVQNESQELGATVGALNDLVNQPAADARPQDLKFSGALDQLVATTRRTAKEVDRMWSKRAAYFAAWDKEIPTIEDDATRHLSAARRATVRSQFDAAGSHYDEAQEKLRPAIAYLQDIRKALSLDLTREGLVAIKPSVNKANESARQVQATLAQSAAELDALSAKTASFRVQETK